MNSHRIPLPLPLVRAAGRHLAERFWAWVERTQRAAELSDLDALDERALRDIGMADRMRGGAMPMREIRAARLRWHHAADGAALDPGDRRGL